VLEDSGIVVVPVEKQVDAWLHSLNVDEDILLQRLTINLKRADGSANQYSSYLRKSSLDPHLESQLSA